MNVGPPLLALDLASLRLRLVVVVAVEHRPSAVPFGRLHLRDRSVLRHHDRRVHARPGGRQRDPLGVIARARGDDPRLAFRLREGRDTVRGASEFERAGPLEVFQFQPYVGAGDVRERVGVLQRRPTDDVVDPVARRLDVGEREHTPGFPAAGPNSVGRTRTVRTGTGRRDRGDEGPARSLRPLRRWRLVRRPHSRGSQSAAAGRIRRRHSTAAGLAPVRRHGYSGG